MTWAVAPEPRDQLVLFPSRLDEVVPEEHLVRDLDASLRGLDWKELRQTFLDLEKQVTQAVDQHIVSDIPDSN